ncbi:NPCBM/NEW2 domain-containing protein [Urbifossiella limnaea]|uniref:NPCBM/NEW2 domain protein n=1 Tax=Urbifossiella limnaea TaxID=2528023 RepID=A0A517XTC7_9BACT|nr:NPCBM/NEW2 domain-containing protein [Urbifossiella limnaea]QDU20745.1 NPCBM/NEW2 domain protein [Urbifossiella limnaea]
MGAGSFFLLAALAAGQPDRPTFEAVGPAAERSVGRLVRLADGRAALDTADGEVTVTDLVSLRRVGVPRPAFPRGPGLLTTTDDRVPGRLVGGGAEVLRFQAAGVEEPWAVPLPAVAVSWLGTQPAGTPPDPARMTWLGPTRKRDVLRFRNGDTTAGTVVGFAADGDAVTFKPDAGEERAVPLATVGAVAFNPALASARRPKGAYTLAVLRDGTRLHLVGASADETTLRGKTLFGPAVELPMSRVVALDTLRGKATELSAMRPKAEQGGFLGVVWPWAADRTVRGEPLSLLTANGVETFDRGLGTHPRTVLTFELGGKYRRFESLVGLDPVTGRQGRAVVRVAVDGKDVGTVELIPGPAVSVRQELAGARQMALTVDSGPAGDVQADVNWADARLVE